MLAVSYGWAIVRRSAAIFFFLALPASFAVAMTVLLVTGRAGAMDFHTFWASGKAVVHGASPYPRLSTLPRVANKDTFSPFVYPAPAAVAMVPFGVLPFKLAAVLWLVLQLLAVVVSLRLLGVRDWRCHGAVLGSMAMLNAIGVGAVGPLLLLGVAAAWRYRDRALLAGAIVGAVAVAKLFLWPLGLWLLVTRRYRAAATAIGVALLSTLLAWALIGFAGLRDYPTLLSRLTGLVGPNSYSLYALGRALGLGAAVSQYVPALLAVALVLGARKRSDAAVLTAAVAACLIATPILWTHYLVLLAVPLALASRRLTVWWVVPMVLLLFPDGWSYGRIDRIVIELAIVAAVFLGPIYSARMESTWSAWVSGLTLRRARLSVPSSAMTKVERSTPI